MSSTPLKLALVAAFGFALAFIFSCSDTGGGNNNAPVPVRKEKISGVSQKGPFAEGAKVIIRELNLNLMETGVFSEGTTDNNGNFEVQIKNGALASQFVIIEVNGKYVNEVSGDKTSDPINLYAIADVLNKDSVNINVFTHLEYDRVRSTANYANFDVAKREAQKKVLAALGMDESVEGNSEDLTLFGNAKLLAASVLLQANNRSTENVSNLLTAIGSKIKDGVALSQSTKDSLVKSAEWVKENIEEVNNNIKELDANAKVLKAEDIGNIVAGINGSSSSGGGWRGDKGNDIANYRTVKIGTQTWMAENLNYDVSGSKCYNNNPDNCAIYGRLYDWATAMGLPLTCNESSCANSISENHRGICPSGWHLPSNTDWNTLMKFVEPNCSDNYCTNAGKKLKATSGWYNNGNGTDNYGFAALPGGVYDSEYYHEFGGVGEGGVWWSSLEVDNEAYGLSMIDEDDGTFYESGYKFDLLSVRCLKD